MLNLLGELWINWGQIPIKSADAAPLAVPKKLESDPNYSNYFDLGQLLALPGLHLHLYGKLQPKPGRKMGHLTISAATVVEVKARALLACRLLGIEPLADWLAP
jgi:5-(carboxyamino)imidazole ribonucleotide synthase